MAGVKAETDSIKLDGTTTVRHQTPDNRHPDRTPDTRHRATMIAKMTNNE